MGSRPEGSLDKIVILPQLNENRPIWHQELESENLAPSAEKKQFGTNS